MSHNAKHKQLPRPQKTPSNLLPELPFSVPAVPFLCKRLMWKVQMLISTPLRKVNIITPPTPVIVPNTLALPAAFRKFNFSKLRKLKKKKNNVNLSIIIYVICRNWIAYLLKSMVVKVTGVLMNRVPASDG